MLFKCKITPAGSVCVCVCVVCIVGGAGGGEEKN